MFLPGENPLLSIGVVNIYISESKSTFLPGENPLLSIGVVSVQLRRNLLTGARGELGGRASTRSVFEQIWQIVFFVKFCTLQSFDSDISSLFVSVFLISVFVTIFHDGGCANVTASVSFSWQSERENDTKIFLRKMKVKVTQNNSSLCQRQMCTWLGGKWQSSAKQEKNISRCFPKNIFQLFFLSLFGLFSVSVLYWWWFPGAALVNLTQENGAVHFNQSLIHQDCSRNTWQQELFFLFWFELKLVYPQCESPGGDSPSLFSSTWPTVSSIKIYTQSFF